MKTVLALVAAALIPPVGVVAVWLFANYVAAALGGQTVGAYFGTAAILLVLVTPLCIVMPREPGPMQWWKLRAIARRLTGRRSV